MNSALPPFQACSDVPIFPLDRKEAAQGQGRLSITSLHQVQGLSWIWSGEDLFFKGKLIGKGGEWEKGNHLETPSDPNPSDPLFSPRWGVSLLGGQPPISTPQQPVSPSETQICIRPHPRAPNLLTPFLPNPSGANQAPSPGILDFQDAVPSASHCCAPRHKYLPSPRMPSQIPYFCRSISRSEMVLSIQTPSTPSPDPMPGPRDECKHSTTVH